MISTMSHVPCPMSPRLCSAYEGSGGGDMCWYGECHPQERCTDCSTCSSCPTADLASWREPEDLWYTVACRRDSAVVRLSLEPMLIDMGWLDGVSAEIVYTSQSGTEVLSIDNLLAEEVEVPGLHPGSKYSFSLILKNGSAEKRFLPQVSCTIYLALRHWRIPNKSSFQFNYFEWSIRFLTGKAVKKN